MNKHNTYEQQTCPGCGYALDDSDMNSDFADDDLWSLAPDEGRTPVCPGCGYALDDSDMNSDLRTH